MSDTKAMTPFINNPAEIRDTVDWGVIPSMVEGESHTSGKLLYKGPGGSPESGIWICTPGYWNCEVTADEFCHFLLGRCTYTHESVEVIEITPDTVALFPKGLERHVPGARDDAQGLHDPLRQLL